MMGITVKVRQGCGTYFASGSGLRASCTAGERQAVERLAEKFFGPKQPFVLEQISADKWTARQEVANAS